MCWRCLLWGMLITQVYLRLGGFFFWFLDIVIGCHSLHFLAGEPFISPFWVCFWNQLHDGIVNQFCTVVFCLFPPSISATVWVLDSRCYFGC